MARKLLQLQRQQRHAACMIQTIWRGSSCRSYYLMQLGSVVTFQSIARGFLSRRYLRSCHEASKLIQKAWISFNGRLLAQSATVLIQSHWRAFWARRIFFHFRLQKAAACAIQSCWRGCYCRLIFAITVESIILVQKSIRGFLSRRKLSFERSRLAATVIQAAWRAFSAQVQYQLDILDIIAIQAITRRRLAVNFFSFRCRAVFTLQRAFRCAIARRVRFQKTIERDAVIRMNESVMKFQVEYIPPFIAGEAINHQLMCCSFCA